MKTKKRLIAWFTTLTLALSFVLPANILNVYADETTETVNVETIENLSTEPNVEPVANENVKIQVLATTDLHGKFKNYSYPIDAPEKGGLNQIAEVVNAARAENPNTIVVDNGDSIQGNYNHLFTTMDYAKKNPMGLAFTTIGYDALSLGNHEFNFGMDYLHKYEEQVKTDGSDVLCANLYKDGRRVFDPYTIKEYEGVKVAIIGVVSPYINRWDADKLVGYDPTNPAEEVNKVIDEIKASDKPADVYVVVSHVGLDSEYGDGDSARAIAETNNEVSLIIAGHSHATIDQEKVNNAVITQPTNYGQGVSKATIEVEKKEDGTVNVVSVNSAVTKLNVDSAENAELNKLLQPYHDEAIADAHSVIGKLDKDLAEQNEIEGLPQSLVSDQGVTDLINEVQIYYSNKQLENIGVNPNEVHHVSSAAMLDAQSNMKAGDITKSGVASIYKFDNTLYTIKTDGKQLKKYMEWSAQYYNTFIEGQYNISLNTKIAAYNYDMFTGVNYEINISKPVGNRIEKLTFNDGTEVKDTDVIYLTMNNYRYNSKLNAAENPVLDPGTHVKVCDSTNDQLFAVRDMIADYIVNVKGGVINRTVDNNWKVTGVKYEEPVRGEVIKLISQKVLTTTPDKYGVTNISLTWNDIEKQLTDKNEINVLNNLKSIKKKYIDIFSFNDFHGNVLESGKNIGAAKLAGVLKEYKAREYEYYGVVPVAAGDLYQGTAISNIKYGVPVTDMLKEIGLVASAIGNHEYDWGADRIPGWAKDGGFEFLAANIVKKADNKPVEYANPYKIVEQKGIKIAFIGIAAQETAEKTLAANVKDIKFLNPVEVLPNYVKEVKAKGADVVVVLAHSAANQDSKTKVITGEAADIAKVDGVDAVVSGHNHAFVSGTVDRSGKAIPVVQGGYNGRGLGALRFIFDSQDNFMGVEQSVKELYKDVAILPVDEAVAAKIKAHNDELAPMMEELVTTTEKELSHEDRNSAVTPLGVIVAETMRQIAGTQIGLTNGGGIRRTLAAGDITVGDMYEILPFDNTLVTVKVTGEELVKIIEHGINTDGFGWGQFAGIKVWYDVETGKVSSIRLNDGSKIDPKAEYSVVINDFMLTGGDGYDFSEATNAKDTFVVMRDAMANNWKENGIPKVDYNVLVAGVDDTVDPEEPVKPEPPKPEEKPEKPGTLPQTGGPIGADMVAMMGITAVAVGGFVYKRRKKNA